MNTEITISPTWIRADDFAGLVKSYQGCNFDLTEIKSIEVNRAGHVILFFRKDVSHPIRWLFDNEVNVTAAHKALANLMALANPKREPTAEACGFTPDQIRQYIQSLNRTYYSRYRQCGGLLSFEDWLIAE